MWLIARSPSVLYASVVMGSILPARDIAAVISQGKYDPFGAPCYPCIEWLWGIVNPLENAIYKLGCIACLKNWVKRIIRRNRELKINVTAVTDPLILDILKVQKNTLPDVVLLRYRLNAIRCSLDMDFPELVSPASACSTPRVVIMSLSKLPISLSEALASPPCTAPGGLHQEQQTAAAPSAEPLEPEASTSREDSTRDPCIMKIYEFMGSFDARFERIEKQVGLRPDGKKSPGLLLARRVLRL